MRYRLAALALAAVMLFTLAGCSMLERGYGSVTPHVSSYYESEAGDVLRAENYQDLVNDLLVLIGDYAAEGTIWLYHDEGDSEAEQAIEDACQEVQRETPMGSYAVEYITYTVSEDSRLYSEIVVSIAYRRSEAQLKGIVHATSVSALNTLLPTAVENGAAELVVQVGYFQDQAQEVRDIVAQIQQEQTGMDAATWEAIFYPSESSAGIVEIIMED